MTDTKKKKRKHGTGRPAARKKQRVGGDSTVEEAVEVVETAKTAKNTAPPIAPVSGPSPAFTRQKSKRKRTLPQLFKSRSQDVTDEEEALDIPKRETKKVIPKGNKLPEGVTIAEERDSKRQLSTSSSTPSIGSKKDNADAEVENVPGNSEFADIFRDVGVKGVQHEVPPNMEEEDEITPVVKVEPKPKVRPKRKLAQMIPVLLSGTGMKKRKVGSREEEAKVPDGNVTTATDEIIVVEDEEGEKEAPTATAFKYDGLDGSSLYIDNQDMEGVLRQPHIMMRTDALLCACTLAMRKGFDAQRHVFVYDVPVLQAYVSGDQRNIPGTEKKRGRKQYWSRVFNAEKLLLPLFRESHYSLAVVEDIDSALSCFRTGLCTCPSDRKEVTIRHFDSMGLHPLATIFKGVTRWLYDGGQNHMDFKMTAAEFSAHFKVESVKRCLNDQKDGQLNCGMFTAMYSGQVVSDSLLSSVPDTTASQISEFTKDIQRRVKAMKDEYHGIKTTTNVAQLGEYFRLQICDIPETPTAGDLMQLANWMIDVSVANVIDAQRQGVSRPERKKQSVKTDFKKRFANQVRKGPKPKPGSERQVVNVAMGSLTNAVDCCYHLCGKQHSEGVFKAMRSYPDSDVTVRGQGYLFATHSAGKIQIEKDGKTKKGAPLHTELRILLQVYGANIKNPLTAPNSYTPEARILMQEIAIHMAAVSDYVLQCVDVVAPRGGQTDAQPTTALQQALEGIKAEEQDSVPHKKAHKCLRSGISTGALSGGDRMYLTMQDALKVSTEAIRNGGKTFLREQKAKAKAEKRNWRAKVDAEALEQIPGCILRELFRELRKRVSKRINADPGGEVKKSLLRIFNLANEIYCDVHDSPATPTQHEIGILDETQRTARLGRPPLKGVLRKRSEPSPGTVPTAPQGEEQVQTRASGRRDGNATAISHPVAPKAVPSSAIPVLLGINLCEPSSWLYSVSYGADSALRVFAATMFQVLRDVFSNRHFKSTRCATKCHKGAMTSLDRDIGMVLNEKASGWVTGRPDAMHQFVSRQLKETVVRACMDFVSVSDISCFTPFSSHRNSTFFGPEEVSQNGRVHWRGDVGTVTTQRKLPSGNWATTDGSVGIGPMTLPSKLYGTGDSFGAGAALYEVTITYELVAWEQNVSMVKPSGQLINFAFMDLVLVNFCDYREACMGTKYAFVVAKPTLSSQSQNPSYQTKLYVLDDNKATEAFRTPLEDLLRQYTSQNPRCKTRNAIRLYRIGKDSAAKCFTMFKAFQDDLPFLNGTMTLGFTNIADLIERQLQHFAFFVLARQRYEVAAEGRNDLTAIQLNQNHIVLGIMESARKKMNEFAGEMSCTLNPSQLACVSSWAAMPEAYFSMNPIWRASVLATAKEIHGIDHPMRFGSRMMFCQGPPGTGKSHVAVLLVLATAMSILRDRAVSMGDSSTEESYKKGRVLVICVTNAAVDDLLLKYLDKINDDVISPEDLRPVRMGMNSSNIKVKGREIRRLIESQKKSARASTTPSTTELQVLNNHKVIFSTLGAALRQNWTGVDSFDLVVVDEAAYVEATEAVACLSKVLHAVGEPVQGTSFAFFGDPRQLPPFDDKSFRSWTVAKRRGNHFFHDAIKSLSSRPQFPDGQEQQHKAAWDTFPGTVFQLKTQMRSAEAIGSVVSALYYDGEVTSGKRPETRPWVTHGWAKKVTSRRFPLSVVNIVDTQRRELPNQEIQSSNGGYTNEYEADVVCEMVKTWKHSLTRGMCAVLTPYNAQKLMIEERLRGAGCRTVEVLTFDSSQGKEFDIVLISLVRTMHPESEQGFQFLNNPQAACVALSRAREMLVVICKCTTIARESTVWQKCLCRMYKGYRDKKDGFAFLEPDLKKSAIACVEKIQAPAFLH